MFFNDSNNTLQQQHNLIGKNNNINEQNEPIIESNEQNETTLNESLSLFDENIEEKSTQTG
jgi:hypothetical protein